MALRVITLPQAEADSIEYAEYIAQNSQEAALKWLVGLEALIASLSEMPERYAVIPEKGRFTRSYRRALLFTSSRILHREIKRSCCGCACLPQLAGQNSLS